MAEAALHTLLAWAVIGLAAVAALVLLRVAAPYGRHARAGWGPRIPTRVAWVVMELPASLGFLLVYASGDRRAELVPLLLLGIWQLHYAYRSLVYPFCIRETGTRMPVVVVVLGVVFNCLNAWLNARWISHLGSYEVGWLSDPRFVAGGTLFLCGMALNRHADSVLRSLRLPGESGYALPRGGAYRWISCPNYLGEILEWLGWALATWSLAGLAFALFTIANLVPRALSHHRWYRATFADFPARRRALLPFLF